MMATAANSAVPKGKGGRGDLHETVLDALGQRVVTGDIPEGTVLRLAELEAQFEVSRGVVREAVRVLESMQVVRSRRRVGVCVLPQAQWDPYAPRVIRWRLAGPQRLRQLNWINELRSAIEPVAAKLAAQRATPEQCGLLTGAVIGMTASARAGDLETYLQHDQQFHRTVLAGSGNPMFRGLAAAVEE
ncbi:MAG: FadR/GntR family transcriptional regulator, partial [Sciscionella sp.]